MEALEALAPQLTGDLLAHALVAAGAIKEPRERARALTALAPHLTGESMPQALAVVEANFSPDWEGSYLAWLLRCLQDAGLLADHPLVVRCVADLERKQRPDGSWESEDGEEYAVGATIDALRVLKGYGLI